jgi:hypothetical protein
MNKVIPDFPKAWAVLNKTKLDEHHEKCSYRTTNRAILCDCAALMAFIATCELLNLEQ